MTNSCCGLEVIFCGFISLLIGGETIIIPEIFSGVHGFTGKTVTFNDKNVLEMDFIDRVQWRQGEFFKEIKD